MKIENKAYPQVARILEIGCHAVIKSAFPDSTRLLWTSHKLSEPVSFFEPFTLRAAWQVRRELRAGKIDFGRRVGQSIRAMEFSRTQSRFSPSVSALEISRSHFWDPSPSVHSDRDPNPCHR
jgi:hypothetical protein